MLEPHPIRRRRIPSEHRGEQNAEFRSSVGIEHFGSVTRPSNVDVASLRRL